MKKNICLWVFILMILSSHSYAKNFVPMDMNNPSVQLLKKISDEATIERQKDIPVPKAYMEEDVKRSESLKQQFFLEAYGEDLYKKNPENK